MSVLAHTVRDISGWSCASDPQNGGSIVPSRDYLQGSGPYPTKQVDPNTSKNPKTVPIKGTGHRSAMLDHLQALFDWTAGRDTKILNDDPKFPEAAVDFDKSAPGRALANLRERQRFALSPQNGLMAAYVDDSRVRPGAGAMTKVPRWAALGDRTEGLWDQWDQARRRILSSDQWKQIELADVPGGPSDPFRDQLTPGDRAFYQALVDKGLRPGGGVSPQKPGLGRVAVRPPPPPPPHGYLPDLVDVSRSSALRTVGVLGATTALAGVGYLAFRRLRARGHVPA